MLAALQAPVIMMSQNRQDTKDRLRGELDYEVNRRAASDIQGLARKLNLLVDKIDDIDESLRHLGPGMPLARKLTQAHRGTESARRRHLDVASAGGRDGRTIDRVYHGTVVVRQVDGPVGEAST